MKKLLPLFLVFFVLVDIVELKAQNTVPYNKKWLLGMNWGGAWENADVHSRLGTGWGLTLEREVIANNTSVFGFSLRGRYLHTWMWGRESKPFYGIANDDNLNGTNNSSINYLADGYAYRNFYTKTDEFSLEGLLVLNKLRAHSGFKIYGFGGIGATGYLSKINQLDGSNNQYDYSGVSTFSKSVTKNDLNQLWDKTYETNGVAGQSKTSFVMSGAIGIGIGIKLSPNVYLGWEHKYTYTSTDMLDASKWKNDATPSLKNDRYHYSSLFVTVALGAGKATANTRVNNHPTYYPSPASLPKPEITQLYPHENPAYIPDCNPVIKLSITNISSINQITVLKDGSLLNNSYYTFDQVTEVLTISTPIMGNTIFSVIAENNTGKDTKYVYTNCTAPIVETPPVFPVISIISSNSDDCIAHVIATVKNVTDPNSIQVIMDGVILSTRLYSFNLYNGSVVIAAPFNQFTTITIRALNNGNSVVQSVSLSCNRSSPVIIPPTQQIPIINITNAIADRSNAGECVASISATISGVTSVNNIHVTQNGILVNYSNYTFDPNSGILLLSHSITGSNTFLIKAQNAAGAATSNVHLDCTAQSQTVAPAIVLINPATSTYTSNSCRENIALKVTNIASIQNIDVRVNGTSINKTLLHFDTNTSILRFDVQITNQTLIVVYVSNAAGNASQNIVINCEPASLPAIQITSPAIDPFVSLTCKEIVSALVTGITDKSAIHVTQNGILLTSGILYDVSTGKLTIPVNFSGRSDIQINAVGKGGSVSESITLICQPSPKPVITIVSPSSNSFVSTTCKEQIIAQVENVESITDISATINGIPVANNVINYNAVTGMLSFPAQFVSAASVVIQASNTAGITSQTLTLQCQPVIVPKPDIQLLAPVAINSISKTCTEAVKLKLVNCTSVADISVSINNQKLSADQISFNEATGILDFQVSVVGTTVIVITAKNSAGALSKTITIKCQPTIQPSVSILGPVGSPVISATCNENIKAVVTNVSGIDQIEVTFNNNLIDRTLLSYDTISHMLQFVQAFSGNGNLIIKASNETGSDSKTISLQCKPVLKPELSITNPVSDPWASETCIDTIVAVVKNIESIDGITAASNNTLIPKENIAFDPVSGIVRIMIHFNSDREIKLTATNAAGSVSQTIHLTCSPVLQPTITLTNPVSEDYSSTTCQENVLMTLTNISSVNQIQVKNNGAVVDPSLYTYNSSTGMLTIPTVIEETTVVDVLATNKTKTVTKTIKITCNKLPLPVVSISSPTVETAVLNNCNTKITAAVSNITSTDQLIISVNGKVLNTGSYTFNGQMLSFPVSVTDRSTVSITATNSTGAASDHVTLICNVSQVVTGPTGNTCSNVPSNPITNCTICNDTIEALNGDISVDLNKKVCIVNNFNGNVNMNGGQLVICGNASIHTINFNSGDIVITGTAAFDNLNMNNTASALRNYGTVQFSNITFNGRFENHGQATVRSDFNVNSSAVFINTGTMNATMSFNNNNFVCNSGTVLVGNNYKDNGSAEFTNSCKLVVNGQINIDHIFNNSGSVSVASISYINGSGKLTMNANSKWITDGLIVNGTIAGSSQNCSSISVSNQTTINSTASLSGKIDICDLNGIELKSGSIATTVTDNCICTLNMSGNCGLNDDLNDQVTICHKPVGSANIQTLTISRSALSEHLAHGDHIGSCTDADQPVNQDPEVIPPVVVPPVIQPQPTEETMIICHKPTGNSIDVQTITILKSALAEHLAHGDHIGACTDADGPVSQQNPPVTLPVVVPPVRSTTSTPAPGMITICHKPGNGEAAQTLNIPKGQLVSHLAHPGDHVGACTNQETGVTPTPAPDPIPAPKMITICHKPGNGAVAQTLSIPEGQLVNHLAHPGDHVGACTNQETGVTPTPAPDPTPSSKMITICHKPGNGAAGQTLSIPEGQLAGHLAHPGDHVGACTNQETGVTPTPAPDPTPSPKMVTICHKPGNGAVGQTLSIPEGQLVGHLAHPGDHVGACTNEESGVTPTPVPTTPNPTTSTPAPKMITICHKPGNGAAGQTLSIPEGQLAGHLAHPGDHIGVCTNNDNGTVTTPVPTSPSPTTPAPAPKMITICHKPGNGAAGQTLSIPQGQLAGHLAHPGDHLGACTNNDNGTVTTPPPAEATVTICHKKPGGGVETLTIPQSQLAAHLAHGDHVGVCRPDEMVK